MLSDFSKQFQKCQRNLELYKNGKDDYYVDSCLVLPNSIWRFIYKFLNVCPFDCMTVVGSGKVLPLNLRVTTLVGWLLLLQLTVQVGP